MEIITGGARHSEHGNKFGSAGDQKQKSIPDYDGEVKLSKYSESSFMSSYWNSSSRYYIYRPINPDEASTIAQICITACNNPNIGYSQATDGGDASRQGIFNRGADTTVPINCDCSSLGSYCVTQATGVSVNTDSRGMGAKLKATGHFMEGFPVSQIDFKNVFPYNGDVMVKDGHVEMVVAGNPREGKEDEVVTGTWTGTQLLSYRNTFGGVALFEPRTIAPGPEIYYYQQSYGGGKNGSYAWGRFSEIMGCSCDLSRDSVRRWYVCQEDGYQRSTLPAFGAVMCFTNIIDANDPGYACIVEGIQSEKLYTSQVDPKTGSFEYGAREARYGSWDMDLDGDGKYEYVFQGFIYNPVTRIEVVKVTALEKFLNVAANQSGTDGSYTQQRTGLVTKTASWSAAFIVAVALGTEENLLNTIIPNTFSCSDIGRIGVVRNMGTWLNGPALGGKPEVKPGDIALFRTNSSMEKSNRYAADKAGIVVEVNPSLTTVLGTNQSATTSFKVIMGDVSNRVKAKTFTTESRSFSGIFRPDWNKVDGSTQIIQPDSQYKEILGLYTEGTSLEDAAIRDLRYVTLTDSGFEPSIKQTGLKLCAINYTGMLANLYTAFAEVGSSAATNANMITDMWTNSVNSGYQNYLANKWVDIIPVSEKGLADTSTLEIDTGSLIPGGSAKITGTYKGETVSRIITLNNVVKTLYDLINTQIKNPAGTVGILGNMIQVSNLDTGFQDKVSKRYGLIGWSDIPRGLSSEKLERKRATEMKKFCLSHGRGSTWSSNLQGQIEYMFYEAQFEPELQRCLLDIKRVTNDTTGIERAARLFLDYYILNGNKSKGKKAEVDEYKITKTWAKGLYNLFLGRDST